MRSPCITTRDSPHTATKTQYSHKYIKRIEWARMNSVQHVFPDKRQDFCTCKAKVNMDTGQKFVFLASGILGLGGGVYQGGNTEEGEPAVGTPCGLWTGGRVGGQLEERRTCNVCWCFPSWFCLFPLLERQTQKWGGRSGLFSIARNTRIKMIMTVT